MLNHENFKSKKIEYTYIFFTQPKLNLANINW